MNDMDTFESQMGKYSVASYETSPKVYEIKGFLRKLKKAKMRRSMMAYRVKQNLKDVICLYT